MGLYVSISPLRDDWKNNGQNSLALFRKRPGIIYEELKCIVIFKVPPFMQRITQITLFVKKNSTEKVKIQRD